MPVSAAAREVRLGIKGAFYGQEACCALSDGDWFTLSLRKVLCFGRG